MPTIVSGIVPSKDFVLDQTLQDYPDLTFEIEQVVTCGDGTLMPMLWVRGESREDVKETIEADPTVEEVSVLWKFDEKWLLQIEWSDRIDLVVKMITNSKATILNAVGTDGEWKIRVFYPHRSVFSKTYNFCEDHGVDFEVESIREVDGEPAGRYGLTPQQYEVLAAATKHGYFEIPRQVNLEELAEELDVSHQALSERLRRATSALIDDTLVVS